MKARTKSARRKSKGGRPRIPGLDRTEGGRIRRTASQTTDRATATVIDMRQRIHGATGDNASRQEWGYVLGRIFMDGNLGSGEIAKLRLEAGNRYAEAMSRYYGLTGVPFPSTRAQNLFSVRGYDGDPDESKVDAIQKATARMMALEGALLSCKGGRNSATTVKNICVMDIEEARHWPPHMLDYLRWGLDAVLFHLGLEQERKIG